MKKLLLILLIVVTVATSCFTSQKMLANANGHYYKYTFAVRETTTHRKSATFNNDTINVHFDPEYNRINFILTNQLAVPVEIDWNKMMVTIHNRPSKVIHSGIGIEEKDSPQSATKVLPGQQYKDFILPVDYLQNQSGKWTVADIYPEKDDELSVKNDWIMGLIGVDMFTVDLPVMINNQLHNYTFHFYPVEMERGANSFKPQY